MRGILLALAVVAAFAAAPAMHAEAHDSSCHIVNDPPGCVPCLVDGAVHSIGAITSGYSGGSCRYM